MNLSIQFDGQDTGAFAMAREMTEHINKLDSAAKRATASSLNSSKGLEVLERRLLDLQNQQRRAAWERLSTEEKLVALKKRAADLDAAAARANKDTVLARGIALKRSMVQAQMDMLGPGKGGFARFVESVPGLGGLAGGAVGGLAMGAAAGFGIGAAVTFLTSALMRSAQHAIQLADDIVDAAEQFRMTGAQMLQLRRAAGSKGIPLGSVMGAMSRVEAARGAAMGGDMESRRLLGRYGVTDAMISGDTSPYDILRTIVQSLGSQGMQKEDRLALGKLLGRRPERIVSAVGAINGAGSEQDEDTLQKLSRVQDVKERLGFKFDNVLMDMTSFFVGVSDFANRMFAASGKFGFGTVTGPAGAGLLPLAYPTPLPADQQPEAPSIIGPRMVKDTSAWVDPAAADEGIDEQMRALGIRSPNRGDAAGRLPVDRLTRMGLFRGGVNPLAMVFERQVKIQEQTLAEIKTLNRALTQEVPVR